MVLLHLRQMISKSTTSYLQRGISTSYIRHQITMSNLQDHSNDNTPGRESKCDNRDKALTLRETNKARINKNYSCLRESLDLVYDSDTSFSLNLPGFTVDCFTRFVTMRYRQLGSTDMVVSVLGLGGSMFGDVFGAVPQETQRDILHHALAAGINYIDTAPFYGIGKAETVLGELLSGVPRSKFYISTKVGRYDNYEFDYSAKRTLESVEQSLKRLKLEYIDIVQVHDIEFCPTLDIIITETLPALQQLKVTGKIKHIGITGYPLHIFKPVIENSTVHIDTLMSYCHNCLFNQTLEDLLPYLKSRGIGVMNAAAVGMGLLTANAHPSWHPASKEMKELCTSVARLCQENNMSISRLAVNFSSLNSDIDVSVVSATSLDILKENIDAVERDLSTEEQQMCAAIVERFNRELKSNNHWEGVELERYHEILAQKE